MPRHRNHYIRGQKITAPAWNGLDTVPSIVASARIVREGLDQGTIEIRDLQFWITSHPKDQRPAFQTALKALGINH
jgi:hypothetical protein